MPDFSRFTDGARCVFQLANQEAQRWNHEYIGTEHILLGLVKEGSGVAARVLKNLGVDIARIRIETEKLVQAGPNMITVGKLPLTPRVVKVCQFAVEESQALGHSCQDTEHLLLGLLREQPDVAWTVAQQVLVGLGLTLEQVRTEILTLLGKDQEEEQADRDYLNEIERQALAKDIHTYDHQKTEVVDDTGNMGTDHRSEVGQASFEERRLASLKQEIIAEILDKWLPNGLDGLNKMRQAIADVRAILSRNLDPFLALDQIEKVMEKLP